MKSDIPPEELRRLFTYNPYTGILFWNFRPEHPKKWNSKWAGKPAGTVSKRGYIIVKVYDKLYGAHRIIWAMMNSGWPLRLIDHKNTIKTDNKWTNLRLATNQQNIRNRGLCKNNTSGYKGVHWHKGSGKWQAQIKINGIRLHLGLFENPEEAFSVYQAKARELHGEFAWRGL